MTDRSPRLPDEAEVRAYLDDVAHDVRVERAVFWRGALCLLLTALLAGGVVVWTVLGS